MRRLLYLFILFTIILGSCATEDNEPSGEIEGQDVQERQKGPERQERWKGPQRHPG